MIPFAAIGVLIAVAYHPLPRNGPVWDDNALIFENPHIASMREVPTLFTNDLWTASAQQEPSDFYRPLTMVTYLVNRAIGGNSPASYHIGNLLLHLAVCWLLYLVAKRSAGERGHGGAFIAAAWFALAPIDSEPVIWLSGRFDLLTALCALAALLVHRESGTRATIAVPLIFIGGMLCKENAVVVPVLLAWDDLVRRRLFTRASLFRYGAIAVLFAGYVLCRRAVGVSTAAAASGADLGELFRAYWFNAATFLRLLAAPFALDPFHPYQPLGWTVALAWMSACLLPISMLWLFLCRHPGHVRATTALFGLGWFLLALAPVTATGPNLQMIGDRYAYLPMAGLFLAMSEGVDLLVEKVGNRAGRAVICASGVALLLVFGAVTCDRIPDWKDEPTLFKSSLRSHPGNPYALCSLGAMAAQQWKLDEAEPLLLESLKNRSDAWRTHSALCFLYLRRGKLETAERYCRSSLALNAKNPRSWVNLASIHVNASRWSSALEEADRALVLKPRYAEGYYLRAVSLANLGRLTEAEEALRRALSIEPEHPGARDLARQFRSCKASPAR